jgi:hypothetical protein
MKCSKCSCLAVGLVSYPDGSFVPLCFRHGSDLTNASKRPGAELPFKAEPLGLTAGFWA